MVRIAAVIVLAAAVGASADTAEIMSDKLTTIASPAWKDRASVKTRFRFVLSRFADRCSDADAAKAADMLVVSHQQLEKAGLGGREPLPELADNLLTVATGVGNTTGRVRCAEVFAAYVVLRTDGAMSVADAREGLIDVYATLGGLPTGR